MTETGKKALKIHLPAREARHVLHAARELDVSESEIIRRAVVSYLDQTLPIARSGEASDARDARLREFVAQVLTRSRTWLDVQHLLTQRDIRYVPRGGGLVIAATADNRIICKASDVGPAYRDLVRRFGHFPGHPHVHIARKVAEDTSLIDEDDYIPDAVQVLVVP